MPPIVAPLQRVTIRNQFAQPHSRVPTKVARVGHSSPQGYRLGKRGENRIDAHDVAINQHRLQTIHIGRKAKSASTRVILNSLYRKLRA